MSDPNNPPAFPQHGWSNDPVTRKQMAEVSGLSRLDYFAAHAPAEPQSWFEPLISPKPEPPSDDLLNGLPPLVRQKAVDWRRDHMHHTSIVGAEEFCSEWKLFWQAGEAWELEWRRERFVQWPYAWAEQVLRTRSMFQGDGS